MAPGLYKHANSSCNIQQVAVGGVTTKLFADKENNCGPHQNAKAKLLKHAATSDNVMVNRPSSSLEGCNEHQMLDEEQLTGEFQEQQEVTEACNLGESTLQSTVHISHSNMID